MLLKNFDIKKNLLLFFDFLIITGVLYILIFLIVNSNKGFDITDESFYILKAMYPFDNSVGLNFGLITGLLFKIVNYNIHYFRSLGIIILSVTSLFTSWQFITYIEKNMDEAKYDFKLKIIYSLGLFITFSHYYFQYWLLTPSYNWNLFFGVLLILGTIIFIINNYDNVLKKNVLIIFSSFVFSICGFIMVNSNPLATFIIGVITLLFILNTKMILKDKLTIIFISILIFVFLIFLQIFFIYENVFNFISIILKNYKIQNLLGGGHNFKDTLQRFKYSLLSLISLKKMIFYFFINFILTLIGIILLILSNFKSKIKYFKNNKINKELIINFIILLNLFYFILKNFKNPRSYGTDIIYLVFLSIIFLIFKILFVENYKKSVNFKKDIIINFLLIFLIPLFMRFGTNNELIYASYIGAYFYFLIVLSIYFLIFKKENIIFRYLVIIVFILLLIYECNIIQKQPYRLITELRYQNEKVELLGKRSILYVDRVNKKWIENLKYYAYLNGWKDGSYILDLTGGTPGAVVVLNGKSPENRWLLGGYPGSDQFVYEILTNMDKNILYNSWILIAPNGTIKISDEVLKKLNINLNNYIKVGDFYTAHRNEHQILYKPKY